MEGKKSAIVTGSTKGIGKAIAVKLLKENYFVILNYANDEESAKNTRNELLTTYKEGLDFVIIKQRIENEEDVNLFASEVCKYLNSIDLLVLNAACTDRTVWKDVSWDDWMHVMNVNLNAPAALIRKLDGNLNDGSNIILMTSIMSEFAHAMSIAYSVSKNAINGLTKALVKEYCERGIRVNAVMPGFVNTPWQKVKTPEHIKRITDKLSLHRFAEPDEIADIVVGIIKMSYINGAIIDASGSYCYK